MRVLGIDASLTCTGWSIIEMAADRTVSFVAAGEIAPKLNDDNDGPMAREHYIAMKLAEHVYLDYGPHFAYIEEVGRIRNASVFRKLCRLSGMICALIHVQSARKIHVAPMTSGEWRSRVGLKGDTKEGIYPTFERHFGQVSPFGEDATEAALLAYAGALELAEGEEME